MSETRGFEECLSVSKTIDPVPGVFHAYLTAHEQSGFDTVSGYYIAVSSSQYFLPCGVHTYLPQFAKERAILCHMILEETLALFQILMSLDHAYLHTAVLF